MRRAARSRALPASSLATIGREWDTEWSCSEKEPVYVNRFVAAVQFNYTVDISAFPPTATDTPSGFASIFYNVIRRKHNKVF